MSRFNFAGEGSPFGNCSSPLAFGVNCSQQLECRFWSEANRSWDDWGCETSYSEGGGAAGGGGGGAIVCACNHLTEFAGIVIPTSAL